MVIDLHMLVGCEQWAVNERMDKLLLCCWGYISILASNYRYPFIPSFPTQKPEPVSMGDCTGLSRKDTPWLRHLARLGCWRFGHGLHVDHARYSLNFLEGPA